MSLFSLPALLAGSIFARGADAQALLGGYWPVYEAANLSEGAIPYSLLNHVDYFLGEPLANGSFDLSGGYPLATALGDMEVLINDSHTHDVTVSLTIGGYYGSMYFSPLVAPENVSNFVDSLVSVVNLYDFDGVDIDWEFPNEKNQGSYTIGNVTHNYKNIYSSQDVPNFITFAGDLRTALGTDKIISATITAAGWLGADDKTLSDYSGFASSLDYLTIMLYDTYLATISDTTGPNAPLYSTCDASPGYSVDQAVTYLVNAGMPADQIVLAVPGYGHPFITSSSNLTWQNISGIDTAIFQKNTKKQPDIVSVTYKELIDFGWLSWDGSYGMSGYTKYWDNCSSTPYLFNPSNNSFISYDDVESVTLKAQYAIDKGLKGVVLFDLSEDTTNSTLLTALNTALSGAANTPLKTHHARAQAEERRRSAEQRRRRERAAAAAGAQQHRRGRPLRAGPGVTDDWRRAAMVQAPALMAMEERACGATAMEAFDDDEEGGYFILPSRPPHVLGHNIPRGFMRETSDAAMEVGARRAKKVVPKSKAAC